MYYLRICKNAECKYKVIFVFFFRPFLYALTQHTHTHTYSLHAKFCTFSVFNESWLANCSFQQLCHYDYAVLVIVLTFLKHFRYRHFFQQSFALWVFHCMSVSMYVCMYSNWSAVGRVHNLVFFFWLTFHCNFFAALKLK